MSEADPQNPTPRPEPATDDPIAPNPDPLLSAGSFIDPNGTDPADPSPEFPPGMVIAAQPISIVAPDGTPAKPATARRNPEEMSKRPSWLPDDWKIDLRVRSSGATAGMIDRYYLSPSGQKFRSKIEVTTFLQTGSKQKRKPNPETDAGPSGAPASEKRKKSSGKRKSSGTVKSESGTTIKTDNLTSTTCS